MHILLKNYIKSKEILEKANKYNPINVKILFELSEIYKMNKMIMIRQLVYFI